MTLTEVLVAAGLSSLVLLVLVSVFSGGIRSFGRGERTAAATLGSLVAAEVVVSELETAFVDLEEAEVPVVVEDGGRALVFYRADPDHLNWGEVRGVARRIEAVKGTEGAYGLAVDGRPVTGGRLADVRFEFIPASDEEAGGVHLVRALLWSMEGGREAAPLVVVKALELPTLVLREKQGKAGRR